jgi:glycerol uptake facilitator-like aquaporin
VCRPGVDDDAAYRPAFELQSAARDDCHTITGGPRFGSSIARSSRASLAAIARELAPHVLAQCAGATLGAFVLRAILGPLEAVGATLPRLAATGAFAVEFLLSFALMLVIMAVATDDRVADGLAGVAVGSTVAFCALLGPLTGSSMNPARSLGPRSRAFQAFGLR